jgi:hypothetical protein
LTKTWSCFAMSFTSFSLEIGVGDFFQFLVLIWMDVNLDNPCNKASHTCLDQDGYPGHLFRWAREPWWSTRICTTTDLKSKGNRRAAVDHY